MNSKEIKMSVSLSSGIYLITVTNYTTHEKHVQKIIIE
jgi:hypothetical protein